MHPSPQRRRAGWLDLTGPWGFAFDDAGTGEANGWHEDFAPYTRTIQVPFPPESKLSEIGDTSYHPIAWYRRIFRISEVGGFERGRRLLLHFGAVDYSARVWLNGRLVDRHEGGHSSFTIDVTDSLVDGDEQVLVVRSEDQPLDLTQPRGKQFWEPEPARIWYHRTSGIWQPVWAEAVGETYISNFTWTPDPRRGNLGMSVRLNREPDSPLRLRLRLSVAKDVLADDSYLVRHQESGRDMRLEADSGGMVGRRLLWTPSQPNLIDAEMILEDESGTVLDNIRSYVGLRSVEADDGLFLLNGRPKYLRLVLAQNYWPDSHLAAPSEEAIKREVELILALGSATPAAAITASTASEFTRRSRMSASCTGAIGSACSFGPRWRTRTSSPKLPWSASRGNGSRSCAASSTTRPSLPGCRSTRAGGSPTCPAIPPSATSFARSITSPRRSTRPGR